MESVLTLVSAIATPLAVIAIVKTLKQYTGLSGYTVLVVAAIGAAFGAAEVLLGSNEIYRSCVTYTILALAGSGAIDLKKAQADLSQIFTAAELKSSE